MAKKCAKDGDFAKVSDRVPQQHHSIAVSTEHTRHAFQAARHEHTTRNQNPENPVRPSGRTSAAAPAPVADGCRRPASRRAFGCRIGHAGSRIAVCRARRPAFGVQHPAPGQHIKLRLFFGAAAVFVLAAAAMLWHVPKIWRRDAERMQETLRAMQQDFAEITGSLKTEPPKEPHDEAAQ